LKLHRHALALALSSYTTIGYAETVVDLDWVDMQNLPAQESRNIAPYCTGGFVSPVLSPDKTVSMQYNQGVTNRDGSGEYQGDVLLQGENILAKTDQLSYDQTSSIATLVGSALLRFPGFALSSEEATVNTNGNSASTQQATFVVHDNDMHGTANSISRQQAITVANNVELTRCAPSDNAWSLKSSSLTIDNEKRYAKAWHTQLKVQGVPIFYWPYVSFPLDGQRFTGFLAPTFGFGENDYFLSELHLPFYFNLAPNYDDTLTLHYLGSQGALVENEFRFLTANHNGVNTSAILALPPSQPLTDEAVNSEEDDPARWNFNHKQSGKINATTSYDFSTNWVSDVNYEQVYASKTEATQEQKLSFDVTNKLGAFKNTFQLDYTQPVADSSSTSYLFKKTNTSIGSQYNDWQASVFAEFHSLYDADQRPATASKYLLKRVPEYTVKHKSAWFNQFNTKEQVRLAYFDRGLTRELKDGLTESNVDLNNSTTRLHSQIELSNPLIERWGYFKPTLTTYYSTYTTSNELFELFPDSDAATQDKTNERFIWTATADQGLNFVNQGDSISTTISPRLHYTYTPFVEQENPLLESTSASSYSLFQTQRFNTIDRIGDMNRLSSSISTSFSSTESKQQIAKISLAKGVKLSQERITLTDPDEATDTPLEYSPWTLSTSFTPNEEFSLTSNWELTHEDLSLETYSVQASYKPEDKVFTSLSVTQEITDDSLEREIGFASYFPIRPNIALIGYAVAENNEESFQVENYKLKEFVYGIDYDSCCWSLRLAGYNTAVEDDQSETFFPLETNRGVYFEFTLKGISASFGTIEDFLSNLNIGYSGKIFNYK
jgi:lipopolysaccharide assembly outer membrane protein LptD (OstA)